ncbi:macro domain-containing protein [Pistricoccus aurantiacus]|uniref:Macro domain-containing protein n=1 Tax=Pistricoccus aurantiacus TaxID=1883414 RepID=A0A5B8T0W2_9GAMM|nr:macro domain-containing protein [Pistricoccus aurantiacus]QEA40693.1 macro domain-containing protein [Pistricoccus aurantiacus]
MATDVTIECIQGDIANQPDMVAVVNAANAELRTGGGVAGALHRAAGPKLAEECRPLAPIKPGQAVISGAHDLPNQYVIHCLGPVYGQDEPSDKLLANCYHNAIEIAENQGIESLAFPSLSTGAFGYPMEEAARVAMKTVIDVSRKCRYLKKIRFVLFDEKAAKLHQEILDQLRHETR